MKKFLIAILSGLGVYRSVHAHYQRGKYFFDRRLRKRNKEWTRQGAPDGLPIPPPELINLVAGHFDVAAFFENGRLGADCIDAVLKKNGIDIGRFLSLLDFGCGCGRICRFWYRLTGPKVHGSDYNPKLVRWCRDHLTFGEFKTNEIHPPLDYPDESFGFIYAISVFTHLKEELQIPWMKELRRVCRPGGYLLLTVHGESYLDQIPDDEKEKFLSGKLAVIGEKCSGSNICGVFHPESYVRNVLSVGFDVIDFLPLGAKDAKQDMALLRRVPLP